MLHDTNLELFAQGDPLAHSLKPIQSKHVQQTMFVYRNKTKPCPDNINSDNQTATLCGGLLVHPTVHQCPQCPELFWGFKHVIF